MAAISDLIPSSAALKAQLVAFAARRAPQWGTGDLNYLGKVIRVLALAFDGAYRTIRQLDADWPPSPQSSETALRQQATTFGLSDGAGGYGFRVAIATTSIQALMTGTGGSLVPVGTKAYGPDGVTLYALRAARTLTGAPPGPGSNTGVWDAQVPGSIGNLGTGAVMTFASPVPVGLDAQMVVVVGSQNGYDVEDHGSAFLRLAERLQLTPKGGAPQDFRAWAEDVRTGTQVGLILPAIRAFGFNGGYETGAAGYDGLGGNMVVVTALGSGLARIPSVEQLQETVNVIRGTTAREGKGPVSCSVRAIAPFMDASATGLTLFVRLATTPEYAFDWKTNGFAYTVNSWDGVNKLRLNQTVPLSLKAAIDRGELPTLFVDTRDAVTGLPTGEPIPKLATVIAYDLAAQSTLTLAQPLPVGWAAPQAGNRVYSGNPLLVPLVGQALIDYVDSLGPSRVSGLYDPFDEWSCTASPSGVDSAARAVTLAIGDASVHPVDHCIAGTTLIGVGASAASQQDVDPPDSAAFGPGLWYVTRVVVAD